MTTWRALLLVFAAVAGQEALAGAWLPSTASGSSPLAFWGGQASGPPVDTGEGLSVGRFALTFAACGDDVGVQVSDTFRWAGAAWEVLLFPAGHAGAVASALASAASAAAASEVYASAYLRLVDDHRRQPLPRGLSFSVTAYRAGTHGTPGAAPGPAGPAVDAAAVASRACASHRFALQPPASRSWGFAKFCPRARLVDSGSPSSSSSPSSPCSRVGPLVLEVELGPALPAQPQPLGLVNEGNTCYMNSLLQSLFHLGGFREGVLAAAAASEEDGGAQRGSATAELGRTFAMLSGGGGGLSGGVGSGGGPSFSGGFGGSPGRTVGLCRSLGVDVRLQEDAQEFKGLLLGELEASAGSLGPALAAPFEGKLLNALQCTEVAFAKQWREPFVELALEAGRGVQTLDQALQRYFAPETLEGPNAYKAPGIAAKQRAVKRVYLDQPPEVLHLQLKRFRYDSATNTMLKVNDKLTFSEDLDLRPYLAPASDTPPPSSAAPAAPGASPSPPAGRAVEARYKLHAVLMHAGSYGYGHYFTYAMPHQDDRGSQDGQGGWFRLDDERVARVAARDALRDGAGGGRGATSAYLLQYVRVDAAPALLHTTTSHAASRASSAKACAPQP